MIEPKVEIDKEGSREIIEAARDTFSSHTESLGLLGDNVRYFRARSAIRNFERTRKLAEEAGLNLTVPPLKFLIPYIEQGSLEDERNPVLQEMWAKLLLAAGSSYEDAQVRFVRILSEMSDLEAKLLQHLCDPFESNDREAWKWASEGEHAWDYDAIKTLLQTTNDAAKVDDVYDIIEGELNRPGSLVYELIVFDKSNGDMYSITGNEPRRSIPESAFYGLMSAGLIVHGRKFEFTGEKYEITLYGSFLTAFGYSFFEAVTHDRITP